MEFSVGGTTYRCTKLGAREQFHIVRRLAPVLGQLAPAFQKSYGNRAATSAPAQGEENKGDKLSAVLDTLPVVAQAIAGLSDADADYVIFGLLKAVSRNMGQGLGWAPVCSIDGYQLQYQDIDMPTMLKLAAKALQFNLSGFFSALPSDLKEAVQQVSGQ